VHRKSQGLEVRFGLERSTEDLANMSMSRSLAVGGKSLVSLLLLPVYLVRLLLQALFVVYVRVFEQLFKLTKDGRARFFPPAIYPWTSTLQDNWSKIRSELDAQVDSLDSAPNYQDVAPQERQLTQDDKWKVVLFRVMGHRIEENARAYPETAELIDGIPGLVWAMLSVLKPGKEIAPHRGPYSGNLNCHLALRVPKESEQCGIRVGGEVRHWEEGRMLVFNDRHTHDAWNHSDEIRVVLLMYVIRPLPFPLSAMNRATVWLSQFLRTSELGRIRKLADEAGEKGGGPQQAPAASPG
jgi:ornithine lipid ester-linked acyl 2-hydroxylase